SGRPTSRPRLRRALASLPDGDGAQSVILVAGPTNKPVVALVLLKRGAGLTDVDLAHCHDRNEAAAILRQSEDIGAFDISPATARTLLATALAEDTPADGWADAAAATGLAELHADAVSGRAWLTRLDPDGHRLGHQPPADAIADSAHWPQRHPMIATWTVGWDRMREVDADAADAALRAAIWAAIRRDSAEWAEVMLRAALLLQDAGADWSGFADAGRALLDGHDPAELPIFGQVVDASIVAVREETEADDGFALPVDGGGPPAAPGELEDLLRRAGGEADPEWLDGYLAAVELAPRPIPPESWISHLVYGPDLARDRPAAKRLANLALQRHDGLLECLETPEDVRESVRETNDAGLRTWVRGFVHASETYPDAWPAAELSERDREMLSTLTALARDDAGSTPNRESLAAWLLDRAESTSRPVV
ncbi:UPF0149 family protein, partial [Rhodovibrio salinarum]